MLRQISVRTPRVSLVFCSQTWGFTTYTKRLTAWVVIVRQFFKSLSSEQLSTNKKIELKLINLLLVLNSIFISTACHKIAIIYVFHLNAVNNIYYRDYS